MPNTKGAVPIKALIVDDELAIRRLLRSGLAGTEFDLSEAETGEEAISLVAQHNPEVLVLDLGLPDMDGLTVIRKLREWTSVPIVVLSAHNEERRIVACLEAGADDFVTKPFGVNELAARLRTALRHKYAFSDRVAEAVFVSGHLRADLSQRRVWVAGQEVHLTPIEYRLLATLVRQAGKVVTHRQLLSEVWGPEYSEETQYLRVYLGYLRKKLEPDPTGPKLLLTEPRVGYRLVVQPAVPAPEGHPGVASTAVIAEGEAVRSQ